MSKFRRFSIIYTSKEQAEARLPFDRWMLHGYEGQYTNAAEAKVIAKDLTERHSSQEYYCPERKRWIDVTYEYRIPTGAKRRVQERYKFIIRGVPLEEDYRSREEDRIAAEEYIHLENYSYNEFSYPYLKDGMISFFASEEDAKSDKRTVMKATKYLRSVLGYDDERMWDILEEWGIVSDEDWTFHFAHTREDIRHVYMNGPNSCMSHDFGETHPAEVYASPDLELAYLKRGDEITGRALCNRNTKEYVRIYGDTKRMKKFLEEAGYNENPMCLGNCRLLKIFYDKHRTKIYMPYLDGTYNEVEIRPNDRDYVHIIGKPLQVRASEQSGYVNLRY